MEKLSLNKLIANDIINYGMDKTISFNYIVSLSDFLDDYDDEACDYIKSHINGIIDAIHENENVAQLDYDETRSEFDMVFYFDGLMSDLDKEVYEKAKELGYDFELDELREISYDIQNSDIYDNLIMNEILEHSKTMGREI